MDAKPNRLGIGHLLLWMATTGAVLAVGQWDLNTANLPQSLIAEMRLRTLIWSLGFAPLHGLSLAGLLVFLSRRFWSRAAFPSEPGHWILVIAGAEELVAVVYQVLYVLAIRGNEAAIPEWVNMVSAFAIPGFAILLAVIGACSAHQGSIWNLCIASLAVPPA